MTPTVWILTMILGCLNAVVLYFGSQMDAREDRRKLTLLYTLFLISLPQWINVPHKFNPKFWPLRIFYFSILSFGVLFFAVALVNVMNFIQNRVRKYQIYTIDEIIDSDYRFSGATPILAYMREQPWVSREQYNNTFSPPISSSSLQYPQASLDSFSVCNDIDECLERLTDYENYDLAVGVSRIHAMHTTPFRNGEIMCFDRSQNIANYTISLAFRNDFPLAAKINDIIRNILKGGLVWKWNREKQVRIPPVTGMENKIWEPMTFEHFGFAFYLVFLPGLAFAVTAFFVELYVARKIRQSHHSSIWTTLAKFFDGHRYVNVPSRWKPDGIWIWKNISQV